MTIATAGRTQFEFGQVLEGAFGAIKRNFLTFIGLSAIFDGLPGLVYAWFLLDATTRSDLGAVSAAKLLGSLLTLVAGSILQGALVHGTFADMQGRRASFSGCLRAGLNHFLPLMAIGVVSGFGLLFGFLFFIIPGVILFLMWCVAGPVQVVENVGVFAAFGRSARLTDGRRWAIFGMFVLVWIAGLAALIAFGFLEDALKGAAGVGRYVSLITTPIVQMITSLVTGVISAVLYFELRRTKEGVSRDDLADVFD